MKSGTDFVVFEETFYDANGEVDTNRHAIRRDQIRWIVERPADGYEEPRTFIHIDKRNKPIPVDDSFSQACDKIFPS